MARAMRGPFDVSAMRQPVATGCAAIKLTGSRMDGMSAVASRALTARTTWRLSAGALLAGIAMHGVSAAGQHVLCTRCC
eukprot:7754282-Pyramimonas_sp.AAC.1